MWPIASRLSRSLKIIGTDRDRSATYDFLLVIYSNSGPISYRFRDKRRFLSKISMWSSPCNFVTTLSLDKISRALLEGEKSLTICAVHLFRNNTRVWRTDGRICHNLSRFACMGMLMLTNPRDAFRGQSRPPNILPFHMLGIVSSCPIVTLSLKRAVFPIFDFTKCHEFTQGHWKWYHSIDCVWFPISVL